MTQPLESTHSRADGLPLMSPDLVEELGLDLNAAVPSRGGHFVPMVGLGGSAGSIAALQAFFQAMPMESGMVFVVVLHLSPTHHSSMAEVLGRATKMPVFQAVDGQIVAPNHVYVIPPGKHLAAVDDHLKLTELDPEKGRRVAVDLFFRSLADSYGPRAAAIVLSGADGDGAVGIKRIKERGGLTIAQDPDEAEHPSMPRTAIDTGMIDWILRVPEMPQRLLAYLDHEKALKLPPEEGPALIEPVATSSDQNEAVLREILVYLRTRTERDFSCYKRATILRRIGRRMQVNSVPDLPAYLGFIRTTPGEVGALLQDLLISVTNFFRDREAFAILEQHIPQLFKNKGLGDSVRVWVPACATGEEAYSIAMLLLEHARKLDAPPTLQVFACDLDEDAIRQARTGLYLDTIAADVSEERLRKFFVKDNHGYRVRRELRELVLFAVHDLLRDAPFSRMDLISCRNLLIYLNREAQQRVFDTFHFALRPEGLVFLGSSESVEDGSALFRVLDKKHRLYAPQPAVRMGLPVPVGPGSLARALQAQDRASVPPIVHGRRFVQDPEVTFHGLLGLSPDRASLAEVHFKLIERFSPPSVVVNREHDIVHLSEQAGRFLQFAGGEPTANLLRVVHPMLRVELRAALFRALEANGPVQVLHLPMEFGAATSSVDLRVFPAGEIAPGFLLIVFEEHRLGAGAGPTAVESVESANEPISRQLERQLEQVKAHLRDTVEQYEASAEEMKASNEELQAMNEELRSATEELETSREEAQSINEELATVNGEMKVRLDELATTNSDLRNLMASTSIATVFLDRDFAVTRYTPKAVELFHLIPGDVGRPLADLKHGLEYPQLFSDCEQVLRTLIPVEREVGNSEHTYLARLQPYRTIEDVIAGVVLTFVDVTDRKQTADALQASEERLRMLIESAKDYAIFTTDPTRRVISWNAGAEAMLGYLEKEILGQPADIIFTPEDLATGDAEREARTAKEQGRAGNERWHVRKDGVRLYCSGMVRPLRDSAGVLHGYVKIMRDLTETKRIQEELRKQMDELKRFNTVAVGRENRMVELKQEINALLVRLGEPPRFTVEGS